MLTSELLAGGPEHDLRNLRIAQRAAGAFSHWLGQCNEDSPLRDCGFYKVDSIHGIIWLRRASDIGLTDNYLYLGIAQDRNGKPGGFVNFQRIGAHQHLDEPERLRQTPIYLVMTVAEDPADATDLAYKINWHYFTHEFAHAVDYRRGYLRHKENISKHRFNPTKMARLAPRDDAVAYYNNATEFNAFYLQGLHDVLYQLAIPVETKTDPKNYRQAYLSSYAVFRQKFIIWFNSKWQTHLNLINRRKFERRFAKLYMLVKRSWPDMEAIHDIQAENAEINARLDQEA